MIVPASSRRAARLAAAGLSALLLALPACRTPPDPEAVEAALAPGQRKPGERKIMLIETPRRLREDYRYPDSTKSAFFWSGQEAEWRFKLTSGRYGHAGFRFLVPHNLATARDRYELIFNIAPATMTRYLWVGLVDGSDQPARVLVDLPMARYAEETSGKGFTEVRIPLRDFPADGAVLGGDDDATNGVRHEAAFDWIDTLEVRVIHNGGRLPNRETVITGLRFQR